MRPQGSPPAYRPHRGCPTPGGRSVHRYQRGLPHRRGNSAFTASLTADTTGHHPTDDEADDSVPMMWLANNLRDSRGENPKASVQPVLGARRATTPMRRRQDLPFSLGGGRRPPWACCDLHFRLPVTDCNAPGTVSMALTNAEKQARYRERPARLWQINI
jgi:hypothetical protein